ncbi:MAG TPA: Fe-S cluster assembly protein SufD [Spirochaetia bacterium]|nr:Fe-S cluster assembly protein SufD [Spirochaetia bacterium]
MSQQKQTDTLSTHNGPAVDWVERDEPQWMIALRRKAFESFSNESWPTPQDEEWRRTDITALDLSKYEYVAAGPTNQERQDRDEHRGKHAGIIEFDSRRCIYSELDPALKEKGVRLISLSEALREEHKVIEEVFQASIEQPANRFQSWHYSQWTHGVFLYVPKFVEIADPFLLNFREVGQGVFSAPHVVVIMETGARAVVIQRISSDEDQEIFCNEGADFRVDDAASLEFIRIEDLSYKSHFFNHSHATTKKDSAFKHLEVVFGSKLYKSRLEAVLEGAGGDLDLNGIYFAHKKQHIDIGTIQRHSAPNANSRSFYKGAARQKGRTVYRGLIEVDRNAAQTDAYLTNKNLVLNDGARSDSIPMLKINTNDVKCSHGSTTGKIDEEQLFYLMSRGFSRTEGERFLIMAFFDDVILQCHPSVHEELQATIQERLDY